MLQIEKKKNSQKVSLIKRGLEGIQREKTDERRPHVQENQSDVPYRGFPHFETLVMVFNYNTTVNFTTLELLQVQHSWPL